ncbi:non-ribosomal peptide synthetase [Streptomyces sp. NPDC006539]|uniref:non-ribosomal peptide synthetase n=1 Tax=Streptomyces sp. NPDC006539 TaxID=3155352 RepID=UPI0033BDD429
MTVSEIQQMSFSGRIRGDNQHPAICSAEGTLSYGQLRERIDQYAEVLTLTGAGPGKVVALSLEYGPDAVAALLATVETGAAFVWLDAEQPASRNRTVVTDSGARYLVTGIGDSGDRIVGDLAGTDLGVVRIAGAATAGIERLSRRRATVTVPEDTAMIVYTSGSTGTPKGILQRRGNIDHFAQWFSTEVGITPQAKVLQWAQLTYDAAYAEIFSALSAGAALVVPPKAARTDVRQVLEWIRRQEITHVQTAPSLYRALLDTLDREGEAVLNSVRGVTAAGEALPPHLAARLRAAFPRADIFNMYGPTECILATSHRVTAEDAHAHTVPIGCPLDGREVMLCHEDGTPVAEGDAGEIWVRSRYLVHGYLNRPEATVQAFLPDPLNEKEFRVYRTGDMARRRPDGALEFEGRIDDQVKIRGVRVELGEIEAALLRMNGIVHAAVVPVEDNDAGDRRLVAYVQPSVGSALAAATLRAELTSHLPYAMVPGQFVLLDEMPLTVSGKVDRRSLPALAPGGTAPGRPPQDAQIAADTTGRQLAEIWSQVLGVAADGGESDFFALGGDSLKVPQVRSAVTERFGVQVPVAAFYENPSLGQFAAYLDSLLAAKPDSPR